jgi:hypothetical protein
MISSPAHSNPITTQPYESAGPIPILLIYPSIFTDAVVAHVAVLAAVLLFAARTNMSK